MTLFQNELRIESARLRNWDYRSRGWYFVTICAHEKAHIFGEIVKCEVQLSRIGRIAETDLQSLSHHYKNVQVDSHIVMPNHLHAIVMIDGNHRCSPNPTKLPLQRGYRQRRSLCPRLFARIKRAWLANVTNLAWPGIFGRAASMTNSSEATQWSAPFANISGKTRQRGQTIGKIAIS